MTVEGFDSSKLEIPTTCLVSPFNLNERINAIIELPMNCICIIGSYLPLVEIFTSNAVAADLEEIEIVDNCTIGQMQISLLYPKIPENLSQEVTFVLTSMEAFVPQQYVTYDEEDVEDEWNDALKPTFTLKVAFTSPFNPETLFSAYKIFCNLIVHNYLDTLDTGPYPHDQIKESKNWQMMEQTLWPKPNLQRKESIQ